MTDLRKAIEETLAGIDKCETDDPKGWWSTTAGAAFGKSKLAELEAALTPTWHAPFFAPEGPDILLWRQSDSARGKYYGVREIGSCEDGEFYGNDGGELSEVKAWTELTPSPTVEQLATIARSVEAQKIKIFQAGGPTVELESLLVPRAKPEWLTEPLAPVAAFSIRRDPHPITDEMVEAAALAAWVRYNTPDDRKPDDMADHEGGTFRQSAESMWRDHPDGCTHVGADGWRDCARAALEAMPHFATRAS